ncbi:putative short transient receptor potential channel 2-like protein [Chiroxiphia lanceolata]|uniref:putative short transient receptor potential channel 2-like protein n=1 Tax=Chiroxiphia lanceolata TaxID=296741 RepID=UPI0013CEC524|nr:putative short transient receptor potential channel 2-like protein [Chiroxiphia lanceolata]
MAPVKISYVVSFSSQDPKYPAENLLSEGSVRPWLGCPQDRSTRLSVELQLERASPIGYVDIGNCGCAFLQIEVGRSSWPRDQPYLTLVPTVTLMTPDDSKLGRNRCGVRMFKEADFPVPAVGQHWDRLRLTCSQPFSPRSRFGLSFIRLRTPQEQEPEPPRPPLGLEDAEPSDSPWCSSPDFHQTFFPKPHSRSSAEEQLRSRLWQLEGGAGSPACLSRPARMVLLAARGRALRPGGDPELPAKDLGGPVVPEGSAQDIPAASPSTCKEPGRCRAPSPAGRAPAAASRPPMGRGRAQTHGHQERRARRRGRGQASSDRETGICPICSGLFLLDVLPTHASHCGEEPTAAWPSLSPDTRVSCPICQLPFSMAEVEQHASTCGETLSSSHCLQ